MILKEEKEFKTDVFLLNRKKYRKMSANSNKRIKQSRIKSILYYLHSDLYGYSYITLTPKIYKKLQKIKDIKFSYKFLDGQLIDDEDNDMWVKNVYYYDSARNLFSKLYEIIIDEYCLNDQFWVFDSYYSFIFSDYKISFMYDTKRYKFNDLRQFYKFIFGSCYLFNNKSEFNDGLLSFSKKRYKYLSNNDLKDKPKCTKIYNENNNCTMMYTLHNSQFVYINPKVFKNLNTLDVKTKLYITELDGMDSMEILDSYLQNSMRYQYNNHNIRSLYTIGCSPLIVRNLLSSQSEMIKYHTKNKILAINGNKVKQKKKFNKLFKKLFPGVKYGSF